MSDPGEDQQRRLGDEAAARLTRSVLPAAPPLPRARTSSESNGLARVTASHLIAVIDADHHVRREALSVAAHASSNLAAGRLIRDDVLLVRTEEYLPPQSFVEQMVHTLMHIHNSRLWSLIGAHYRQQNRGQ